MSVSLVITGAGISTNSGISDYLEISEILETASSIQHFLLLLPSLESRKRYWSRSQLGYPVFKAVNNSTHTDLARMEKEGKVSLLITQNVDRLHQKKQVIRGFWLHGELGPSQVYGVWNTDPRMRFKIGWKMKMLGWRVSSSPRPRMEMLISMLISEILRSRNAQAVGY